MLQCLGFEDLRFCRISILEKCQKQKQKQTNQKIPRALQDFGRRAWTPRTLDLEVQGSSLARRVVSLTTNFTPLCLFSPRPGLLEAWLVLTSVKYHGNLYILIPLNQRLALTRLRATGPRCINGYRQHSAGGQPCNGLASCPGGE